VTQGGGLTNAVGQSIAAAAANHAQAAENARMASLTPAPESQAEVVAANALLSLVPNVEEAPADAGVMFSPGTIVWAKVEGHEWWPAQVVRRRAVPRGDVEPPPGGPSNVMNCFPVVFLNQKGVPGEIRDTLDSQPGALAASLRAHKAAAVNEEIEAEYAWVMANSLRKFEAGKYDLVAAQIASNAELATCVRAAEQVLQAQGPRDDGPNYDSDGGWGHAQRHSSDTGGQQATNRRNRGARSRGGRRVRNRRNAPDDESNGAYTFYAPQIVVDAILGWRYPLSKADKARSQRAEQEAQASKIQQLQALHMEYGQPGATEVKAATAPPASEADEAALLLDFQDAASKQCQDSPVSREREFLIKWNDISHIKNEWVSESRVMALAKRKLLNFTKKYGAQPVDLSDVNWTIPERFVARRKCPFGPGWEILVKWKGAWPCSTCCRGYACVPSCRTFSVAPARACDHCFLSLLCAHPGSVKTAQPGCMYRYQTHAPSLLLLHHTLCTPADLGFECCTWESDIDTTILDPCHLNLLTSFWRRQYACLALSRPEAKAEYERRIKAGRDSLPQLPDDGIDLPLTQPDFVSVAKLEPHQLVGAAMLRRMYLLANDAVIADDPALGIAATVLKYMQVSTPTCCSGMQFSKTNVLLTFVSRLLNVFIPTLI
jgi:hypothetical protein